MKKIKALKPKKSGSSNKALSIKKVSMKGKLHKGLRGSVDGEDLIIEDTTKATVTGEDLSFD